MGLRHMLNSAYKSSIFKSFTTLGGGGARAHLHYFQHAGNGHHLGGTTAHRHSFCLLRWELSPRWAELKIIFIIVRCARYHIGRSSISYYYCGAFAWGVEELHLHPARSGCRVCFRKGE